MGYIFEHKCMSKLLNFMLRKEIVSFYDNLAYGCEEDKSYQFPTKVGRFDQEDGRFVSNTIYHNLLHSNIKK